MRLKCLFFVFCFFLLSVTSVYCLYLITPVPQTRYSAVGQENVSISDTAKAPSSAADSTSKSSAEQNSSQKSSAVNTAANQSAVGKIIQKSISHSAANNVYRQAAVKNTTSKTINVQQLLKTGPELRLKKTNDPQVLIVHTHTTECYMNEERDYYTKSDNTRSTNNQNNMVAVGEVLKDGLIKKNIGVIHACEQHDYPEYTGSYNRAAATIKKYLQKYPTIKVVIDLHRDSIMNDDKSKTALVSNINGKKAAQIMLVAGCQDGEVSGFENWEENLKLSLKLQQTAETMYPGLTRPILFTARKYNLNITTGSMLIECGTEANTLDQAKYSAELLANALSATLNMLKS